MFVSAIKSLFLDCSWLASYF